ncbi:hypothetical protein NHX12_031660 [Muraenolepis orangiensis]|uniref:AIG1-type G domain-containing protein n=1 Tax=Muraenolepis orangiensis TaxID=630683 RepID=A0A9Q0E4E0_9TELE|nr:hypothetical protein NHX12_031660 [Muraenolepis orangiensis]
MGENDPEEELRLILIGKTGGGKSASASTPSWAGVTSCPSFGDTHLSQEQVITEVSRCVVLTAPGPHAFLLVVPLGRYTEEDNMAVTQMAAVFGEVALRNHTVVLFTRGDDLEEPMEEYLANAPASFKALIDRCGGRYHVLNNRTPSDVEQVHELMRKVEQLVGDSGGCYTNAMYLEAVAAIREEEEDRIMRGRVQKDGEEENKKMAEQRRRVLERGERADDGEEALRTQTETEERRGGALRPKTPLSSRRWYSEGRLSPKVLQRVKVVVAAGLTGFLVGALCGAAVPLAATAGASLVGKAAGLTAAQLVAGALIGGLVGGSVGAVAGLEAASPREGVHIALGQVGRIVVLAVGLVSLWELWLS